MGLIANEGKPKYMLLTSRSAPRNQQQAESFADNLTSEAVSDFVYLGTAITSGNDTSLEIKRRITFANRCYYGLNTEIKSRVLSRKTKILLNKALIISVLLYGAEAWVLTLNPEYALGAFEI